MRLRIMRPKTAQPVHLVVLTDGYVARLFFFFFFTPRHFTPIRLKPLSKIWEIFFFIKKSLSF